MPRITIHVGGRERLEATITKATPMGLLGTEAITAVETPARSPHRLPSDLPKSSGTNAGRGSRILRPN